MSYFCISGRTQISSQVDTLKVPGSSHWERLLRPATACRSRCRPLKTYKTHSERMASTEIRESSFIVIRRWGLSKPSPLHERFLRSRHLVIRMSRYWTVDYLRGATRDWSWLLVKHLRSGRLFSNV